MIVTIVVKIFHLKSEGKSGSFMKLKTMNVYFDTKCPSLGMQVNEYKKRKKRKEKKEKRRQSHPESGCLLGYTDWLLKVTGLQKRQLDSWAS